MKTVLLEEARSERVEQHNPYLLAIIWIEVKILRGSRYVSKGQNLIRIKCEEHGIMDRIIYRSIKLKCNSVRAFEMFTVNRHLEKWFSKIADVEAKIGGRYELFWNPEDKENDSTLGCKLLAIKPNRFLSFEWKGPKQFKHFMNEVRPLTTVIVFLIPLDDGTEFNVLHTGWRETVGWEEAHEWFERAWTMVLSDLEKYANENE